LAVGDWECFACGLNWQWAKLTLTVGGACDDITGRIEAIEDFVPSNPAAFATVHRVQPELARLAAFDVQPAELWTNLSVARRCEAMAQGFNAWCVGVAGIAPPAA
jgi:hypothetical protein